MSETRQAWKPWLAKTRTAASRIWRRLSCAACWRAVEAIRRGPPRGGGWPGPGAAGGGAVGQARELAGDAGQRVEVELGAHVAHAVGCRGQHDAPGVDDRRAPA